MSFFFKKKIPKFPFPNTKKKYGSLHEAMNEAVVNAIARLNPKKIVLSGPSGYLGSRVLSQV